MKALLFVALLTCAYAERLPFAEVTGVDLVSGKTESVSLSSATKATVVVFLSSRCPCSHSHQGSLLQLNREFSKKGFRFVGVHSNADESPSEASEYFSKRANFGFAILQDNASKLADALGALKTPHAFVVSRDGEVLFSGGVDDCKTGKDPKHRYLEVALNQVVAGEKPDPKDVRTVGCKIAR